MIREDRLALGALAAGSIAVNLSLLAISGVRYGGDSPRYIASAADLLAGRPFRNQGGWVFIGYNGLLAASDALGLGAIGAVLFQAVAAACATLALYDLGRQIGGRLAGVLGAAFFVVNYDIARWHQYVLTDSLYISMVVVTTWAVHRASERGGVSYLGAGVLIAITALVRPNGWLFVPLAAIYWIARTALRTPVKVWAAAGVAVLSLSGALGLIIAQLGSAWTAAEGGVGIEPLPFSRSMTMSMSERVDPALIADRLFRALHHIEPSFSPWHIAAVLVMLAVVYPLAIAGAIRTRGQPLSSLMVAVVLGHLAIIAITFMDRDGRYLLYFFPLVVVFAAEAAVAYGRPRVRRFIA